MNDKIILLAMLPLTNENGFQIEKFIENLTISWGLQTSNFHQKETVYSLNLNGLDLFITQIATQLPPKTLQYAIKFPKDWDNFDLALQNQNAHLIITLASDDRQLLEKHRLFTKVIASILTTSGCLGVFFGSRNVFISRELYLQTSEMLKNNEIPLPLWIYIGSKKSDVGNTVYTLGLNLFKKLELEIINSAQPIEIIYDFIENIAIYVIENEVILEDGDTIGFSESQKIPIEISEGIYVKGESLKLSF
jgi:hypothetical protein